MTLSWCFPFVAGATVEELVAVKKKVANFQTKRRKDSHRKQGHQNQPYTKSCY